MPSRQVDRAGLDGRHNGSSGRQVESQHQSLSLSPDNHRLVFAGNPSRLIIAIVPVMLGSGIGRLASIRLDDADGHRIVQAPRDPPDLEHQREQTKQPRRVCNDGKQYND